MSHDQHNEVTSSFWVQPSFLPNKSQNALYLPVQQAWYTAEEWPQIQQVLRQAESEPWGSSLVAVQEAGAAFHETYGTPRCVRQAEARKLRAPQSRQSTWPRTGFHGADEMIAITLGGSGPSKIGGLWWNDREHPPLAWVESPEDVAKLRVSDWGSLESVQRMLQSRQQWQRDHPEEPLARLVGIGDLPVPGQDPVPCLSYSAFVDVGMYLMGMTHFLTILGGEPKTADALMDLCFELVTSYTDFLIHEESEPVPFSGLGGFGGDGTCMFSPVLYDRYGAAWDDRLFKHVQTRYGLADDAPANLHSCGPSSHLYDKWGAHPRNRNIAVMQTRLIPGTVAQLRANLPQTQLELTFHPPHFDVLNATPDELRDVLWSSARDAGYQDVYLNLFAVVHRAEDLAKAQRNLEAAKAVMSDIRKQT